MTGMGSGMTAPVSSPTTAVTTSSWVTGDAWVTLFPGRFSRKTTGTFVTSVKRKIRSQAEVPGTPVTDPAPVTRALVPPTMRSDLP